MYRTIIWINHQLLRAASTLLMKRFGSNEGRHLDLRLHTGGNRGGLNLLVKEGWLWNMTFLKHREVTYDGRRSIFGKKCPIEDDTNLEADPNIHNDVEDDQSAECKLVGERVRATGDMLMIAKHPQEPHHGPRQTAQ